MAAAAQCKYVSSQFVQTFLCSWLFVGQECGEMSPQQNNFWERGMPLHIQDPTNPNSEYLVDTLLDACVGARAGGGAFAFLSAGGIQLLLKDSQFTDFLGRGSLE